jgi:hypothetical protein
MAIEKLREEAISIQTTDDEGSEYSPFKIQERAPICFHGM